MDYYTIQKSNMQQLVDKLSEGYAIAAPVRKDDAVVFDTIKSGEEIILDYTNTVASPKNIVIPQRETLLSYDREGGAGAQEHFNKQKKLILLGVRPCDARSLVFLDKVFNDEKNRDVYYTNRRDELCVVSLGCTQPQETCFCTTTGGGPFSPEGSDLLLVDSGEDYIIQVITEKGAAVIDKLNLKKGQKETRSRLNKIIQKSEARIEPDVDIHELKRALDTSFESAEWERLSEKCISCGVCTYLCPTCHCFDIVDEEKGCKGERVRIWDSCQFPCFTMQASGFNPRPTFKERYRQRVMHKFTYCIDNYSKPGCVGCGRCVTECPVNFDIRQVLLSFQNRQEK